MNRFLHICLVIFGLFVLCLHSTALAQSSDWVYSPYTQYLTNDTTIPPPVGESADAALSCFRHDTIYVLVMPSGELYIWLRPDPLMDKYIQSSPYAYCDGNPLKYVDPKGMFLEVTQNDDGTYKVANGQSDRDQNIYVIKDGKRTGEILGKMATRFSFFDKNNNPVIGAVINLDDSSGDEFLADFINNMPTIAEYISKNLLAELKKVFFD